MLENIEMRVRVGFGQDWSLGQQVQDIAEKVGVVLVGGSSEQGQLIYSCKGMKIGEFKKALAEKGFLGTLIS